MLRRPELKGDENAWIAAEAVTALGAADEVAIAADVLLIKGSRASGMDRAVDVLCEQTSGETH